MGTQPLLGSGSADSSAGLPQEPGGQGTDAYRLRDGIAGFIAPSSTQFQGSGSEGSFMHGRPVQVSDSQSRTVRWSLFFGSVYCALRMGACPKFLSGQGNIGPSLSHQFFRSFSDAVGLREHLITAIRNKMLKSTDAVSPPLDYSQNSESQPPVHQWEPDFGMNVQELQLSHLGPRKMVNLPNLIPNLLFDSLKFLIDPNLVPHLDFHHPHKNLTVSKARRKEGIPSIFLLPLVSILPLQRWGW
ncbi:hypothetical protein AVEN_189387-1 [Araneus ventricosus]|uniref:Uncharacterized protein n=1 Tax=Araneus ventricosus TaxID=182803 RepID=A0A4Y2FDU0_ARAVE|nr:hypothetical protein AVEN_189387-1 [Araneus ventricosus]